MVEWLTDFLATIPSTVARAVFGFIANTLTAGFVDKLPETPTMDEAWLDALSVYAGYINYFIPVHSILMFSALLLTCIAVYYSVSILLRLTRIVS